MPEPALRPGMAENMQDLDSWRAPRQDFVDNLSEWAGKKAPKELYAWAAGLEENADYKAWLADVLKGQRDGDIQNGGKVKLFQLSASLTIQAGVRAVELYALRLVSKTLVLQGEWRDWDVVQLCHLLPSEALFMIKCWECCIGAFLGNDFVLS